MTHWLQLEPKVIPQTIAIFDFGRFFVRNLEIMHIFIVITLIDGHHVYYSCPQSAWCRFIHKPWVMSYVRGLIVVVV